MVLRLASDNTLLVIIQVCNDVLHDKTNLVTSRTKQALYTCSNISLVHIIYRSTGLRYTING